MHCNVHCLTVIYTSKFPNLVSGNTVIIILLHTSHILTKIILTFEGSVISWISLFAYLIKFNYCAHPHFGHAYLIGQLKFR